MSTSIQRGIAAFKQQIDAPIASFFNSCVRCGMCAEACLFYEATKDPKYTPINKLEPMRRVWKQEYTFWGRLAKTLGISKPVTDADLDEWQELLYDSCTLCGRCSLVCPVGNDLVYMIRKAREGMVASGHAPKGLKEATSRAIKIGSPMGITLSTFKKQVQHAEDESGIKMPFDKQGADYLLLMSSAEIMEFPEFINAMAKIFKQADVSWTFSSEAFEATNSGIQIGSSDIATELVQRIVDAAEKLQVKNVISPECGHAYTAIRWDGPNLIGRAYKFKVIHILELLDQLRREGKIELEGLETDKLTFHDPCQIVRRGGITQEPRDLLNSVTSNFVEMPCAGIWNWCCGGGGGVSANPDADELRLKTFAIKKQQLDSTGAKTLVTSCSNCRNMLEDGVEEYKMDIEVIGLGELIADHLKEQ
ncbi:MAG: (Fe-S)-binding protein [Gammaproteobacteria bacterium]|nr:(Fe-S)-binding protein [Gammaproteobacteria bacterium]